VRTWRDVVADGRKGEDAVPGSRIGNFTCRFPKPAQAFRVSNAVPSLGGAPRPPTLEAAVAAPRYYQVVVGGEGGSNEITSPSVRKECSWYLVLSSQVLPRLYLVSRSLSFPLSCSLVSLPLSFTPPRTPADRSPIAPLVPGACHDNTVSLATWDYERLFGEDVRVALALLLLEEHLVVLVDDGHSKKDAGTRADCTEEVSHDSEGADAHAAEGRGSRDVAV